MSTRPTRSRKTTGNEKWVSGNKYKFDTPSHNAGKSSSRKTIVGIASPWIHKNKAKSNSALKASGTRKIPMKASKRQTLQRIKKDAACQKLVTFFLEDMEESKILSKRVNKRNPFVPLEDLKEAFLSGTTRSNSRASKKLSETNGNFTKITSDTSKDVICISDDLTPNDTISKEFADHDEKLSSDFLSDMSTDKSDTLSGGSETTFSKVFEESSIKGKRKKMSTDKSMDDLGKDGNGDVVISLDDKPEKASAKKIKEAGSETVEEMIVADQDISLAEEAKPRRSWCTIA